MGQFWTKIKQALGFQVPTPETQSAGSPQPSSSVMETPAGDFMNRILNWERYSWKTSE